jgi:lysophospholipase L1-like esterase
VVYDPVLGAVAAPGETLRYAIEGDGSSRWSAPGVRHPAPPDPGRPSIVALGDSFTEALMIDDADVYTQRLEESLAARGIDFPVLNLGASGFSAADYVALADEYRRRFAVTWAVVQLRPNDVAGDAFIPSKTHFRRTPAGDLEVVRSAPAPLSPLLAPLRRRSTLLNYGIVRLKEFAAAAEREPPLFRAASSRPRVAPAPRDYPVEDVLRALGDAWDGRLTLLLLPGFETDRPGPSPGEVRILASCAEWRWSCVSLRERFGAFAARHESPYGFANSTWGRGHMNAAGHHAAAEILTAELARLRALDLL